MGWTPIHMQKIVNLPLAHFPLSLSPISLSPYITAWTIPSDDNATLWPYQSQANTAPECTRARELQRKRRKSRTQRRAANTHHAQKNEGARTQKHTAQLDRPVHSVHPYHHTRPKPTKQNVCLKRRLRNLPCQRHWKLYILRRWQALVPRQMPRNVRWGIQQGERPTKLYLLRMQKGEQEMDTHTYAETESGGLPQMRQNLQRDKK